MYKIIAKVLAKRMARVLEKYWRCQHAFVERNQILDVALIANDNELLKRKENESCVNWIWRKRIIM